MKVLRFGLMVAMLAAVLPVSSALATIQPKTATSTYGYVEEAASGVIKGWVYQDDQPVELSFLLEKSDGSESRTYSITNQQESNKIAYFSQRDDVRKYLALWGAKSFRYPQGFMLTGKFLPVGSWKILDVFNAGTGELIPHSSSNMVLSIPSTLPYIEGYVDNTGQGSGMYGWAYSSERTVADFAPEIVIKVTNTSTNESKTFTLPKGKEVQGYMARSVRQDAVSFLITKRGQGDVNFDHPKGNRTMVGFIFNYNAQETPRPLTVGQWSIDSITADGEPVPYGSSNPAKILIVN